MEEQLHQFWQELVTQCKAFQTDEFEYYWEIWGVNWYPWTIETATRKGLNFTDGYDPGKKLDWLESQGIIAIVKEYTREEMGDEFNRKRYKIAKKYLK
ncbi:hypothetical protein AAEO56_16690 [Flavobacterium sp. DGU11]|uniref:Uncharacterized protein n=1 Tax=Flavobacterium arundinis TaxID=3139143 RepID=A0ABU9I0F8_9FLAO